MFNIWNLFNKRTNGTNAEQEKIGLIAHSKNTTILFDINKSIKGLERKGFNECTKILHQIARHGGSNTMEVIINNEMWNIEIHEKTINVVSAREKSIKCSRVSLYSVIEEVIYGYYE